MKTTLQTNYEGSPRRALLAGIVVAVGLLTSLTAVADTSWVGPSSGDWSVAANWQGGLPWTETGTTDITGGTVMANSDATVLGTLEINRGSLTISQKFTLKAEDIKMSGGGLQLHNGTSVTASSLTINGGAFSTFYSGTVDDIFIGSDGTTGNGLLFYRGSPAEYAAGLARPSVKIGTIHISAGNSIYAKGEWEDLDNKGYNIYAKADLWSFISGSSFTVYVDGTEVTEGNIGNLFESAYPTGTNAYFTQFTAKASDVPIPEPATYVMLIGVVLLAYAALRRWSKD